MDPTKTAPSAEDTTVIQKAIEQIADTEVASSDQTGQEPAAPQAAPAACQPQAPVHHWFFTFMCMNIPVIGWFYLFYLAFNKKYPDRRSFARAYLLYKLVFLIVGLIILAILIHIGLDLLDQLLAYMEML